MKVAGVHYEVNWRAFTKNRSLFFPCLDPEAAWGELRPFLKKHRLRVVRKVIVDTKSGIRGLRIWRL